MAQPIMGRDAHGTAIMGRDAHGTAIMVRRLFYGHFKRVN
jgi:hypothetical protein